MNIKDFIALFLRLATALISGALIKRGVDQGTAESIAPGIGLTLVVGLWAFYSYAKAKNYLPAWLTDEKIVDLAGQIMQGKKTVEEVPGKVTTPAPEGKQP